MSNYLVGIDLGTTNTVVFYLEKDTEEALPQIFPITQVTENGETQDCETLASFIYLPDEKEVPKGALGLPWNKKALFTVGELARKNAAQLPGKVISSIKSWLCVDSVDRLAPILPWNRNNPQKQMSPVEASKQILIHIKDAWNQVMAGKNGENSLENQSVILTVPASFDAVAKELTVKAAEEAGLNVVLLEEPLSAFYSWLCDAGEVWRSQVKTDDVILVCDIGGGTTDFTLIKTVDNGGNLEFERIAVGKHILLGGDNMDLTAAYTVAARLKKDQNLNLDSYQIAGLTHACRNVKETLLSSEDAPPQKLTVLGRSSSLVGGAITAEVTRDELVEIIINGFFPECEFAAQAVEPRRSGLRSFGLSYEANPAVTRHLANFLTLHTKNGTENMPNCILFNGGVSKSGAVKERIIKVLKSWLPEMKNELKVIAGNDPDKSVAKGGAWYGRVREGQGVRIKAGSSHAYYIGIESSMPAVPGFAPPVQALCVVPMGMEEGTGADVPYTGLGLMVGETSEFRFFSSNIRKEDQVGLIIDDVEQNEEIEELPVLSAELPAEKDVPPGSLVPVTLRCELTETGTLQVWCLSPDSDSQWKLEFELRNDDLLTRDREDA